MRERGRIPLEAELGSRIEAALRSGLDAAPVDVSGLASSTHAGIHRAQVRRRIAATGALVVAAVLAVVVASGGSFLHSRAIEPAHRLPSPSPTTSPSPSPTTVRPVTLKPESYRFPEAVGLTAADLPYTGMAEVAASGAAVLSWPTVDGQTCEAGRPAGLLSSRSWHWVSNDPKFDRTASVYVTVWGDGAAAFRALRDNTGLCRWKGRPPQERSASGLPGDEAWAGELSQQDAVTAVRFGNVILGLHFVDRVGGGFALPRTLQLTTVSGERLQAYLGSLTPAPAPSSAAPSTPATVSATPPSSKDDYTWVAYGIPPSVDLRPADFPVRMALLDDLGQTRKIPVVMGQACDPPNPAGAEPVAGRSWSWLQTGVREFQAIDVDFTVTGWRAGSGARAFTELVNNKGMCRFAPPATRAEAAGLPGDDAWVASRSSNGLAFGFAAVREGDAIVTVSVMHPSGRAAAIALARRLVTVAAGRLVAAHLPVAR